MPFGQNVQRLRRAAGLSQEELAERLGVTRQAVSKWERDSAYPEMEKLARMSQLFGVTVEALLNGDPAPAEARPAPPPDGAAAETFLRAQRKVAGLRGGACAAFVGSFALLLALQEVAPAWAAAAFAAALCLAGGLLLGAGLCARQNRLDGAPPAQDPEAAVRWERLARAQRARLLAGALLIAAGVLVWPMVALALLGEGAPPAAQAVGMALAAAGAFLCAQAGSLARAEHKLRDAWKRRDSE